MYCKSCGAQVYDGAKFCPACGAAVDMPVQYQNQHENQYRYEQQPQPQFQYQEQQPQDQEQPVYQTPRSSVLVAALAGITLGLVIVVGAIIGIRSAMQTSSVAVVIPIKAPGLDENGTRVPVQVESVGANSSLEIIAAYVEADGSGLCLEPGEWNVKALGSPISSAGVIYEVPDTVVHVVLDDAAIESGKTSEAADPISFVPIDPADLTDEEIEHARELAEADDGRDAQHVAELVEIAQNSRATASENVGDEDAEQGGTSVKTDDGKGDASSEGADAGEYTIHMSHYDFAIPEAWRGKVDVRTIESGVLIERNGIMLLECLDGKSFYGPTETATTAQGGNVVLYTGLDDFGVACLFGHGISASFVTFNFCDDFSAVSQSVSSADLEELREMQAAACGLNASADSLELAKGTLVACAENTTFVDR